MDKSKQLVFIATNFLALLGWISMNIYLPSIPFLEQYFHASPYDLKLSITIFLIGFALSQFFWGSISERYGRIKPILTGLSLASLGTILVLCAPNIWVFNMARFIEGAGIGAAAVLTRAVLADSFSKLELSKAFSLISTSANIMPALAPIVGGYLMLFAGWRAIFVFLLLYTGFLLYLFGTKVAETNQSIRPDFQVMHALKEYLALFKLRGFLGYLFPYAFLSGGMIGFYAATPFIFMGALHLQPQHYAFSIIFTVLSYIAGANLSSHLAKKLGFDPAIMIALVIALSSGIILISVSLWGNMTVFTVVFPMMFYTFAAGLLAPNANASAMSAVLQMAGAASAVMGTTVYMASACLSAVIVMLNFNNLLSLAGYVLGVSLLAIFSFAVLILAQKRLNQQK